MSQAATPSMYFWASGFHGAWPPCTGNWFLSMARSRTMQAKRSTDITSTAIWRKHGQTSGFAVEDLTSLIILYRARWRAVGWISTRRSTEALLQSLAALQSTSAFSAYV